MNSQKNLFRLFQDNRNPTKGISLFMVDNQEEAVEINYEEVDEIVVTWGYSLLGYVAGGLSSIKAITRMRSSWNTPNKFHLLKSGWLVFSFDNEEDR